MDVPDFLHANGGSARWAEIRAHFTQRELEAARSASEIVRTRRGVYALPRAGARQHAKRLGGVVSHYTAAYIQNMGAIVERAGFDVSVKPGRTRVRAHRDVHLHYIDIPPEDVSDGATTYLRTAIDCARTYPVSIGLTVAETGVLQAKVDLDEFRAAVARLRGPGAPAARFVAQQIDLRPQSPMETYLRAVLLEAGITCFQPQFQVISDGEKLATTDLGDPVTMTLVEADSFAWHGNRQALADDALRYNTLVAHGYAVLRVAWEHLLYDTDRVVDLVRMTLERRGVKN